MPSPDASLALQLALYRRQQAEIRRAVERGSATFRAYEGRYRRATRAFRRSVSAAAVTERALASDVLFVGDYHTLRAAQAAYLGLAQAAHAGNRPVILALEWAETRQQPLLDAFLAGRLTEDGLLHRLGHRARGFDLSAGVLPILRWAKRARIPLQGIDRRATGPSSLATRDAHAARRIATLALSPGRPLVLVLVGQYHVTPCHLPREVERALGGDRRRLLVLYQNCEALYWKLARAGRLGVGAVELSSRELCLFNASPLLCQQSFLDYLDAEAGDQPLSERGLTERFRQLARTMAGFLGVRLGRALAEVQVCTASEPRLLERIRRRGGFTAPEIARVRRQILARESYYIPRARLAYLASLSLNHAAEEAAHFVRHACVGDAMAAPRPPADAFYARVLEEAIGFFGSRLVNPGRACRDLAGWAREFTGGKGSARQVAAFVLAHEAALDRGGTPLLPLADEGLFHAVSHALGYLLGDRWAAAWTRGRLDRRVVQALMRDPFPDPRATYLAWRGGRGLTGRRAA